MFARHDLQLVLMASVTAFWAPGTRVCFGSLEFIAKTEETLVAPQLDMLESVLSAFRTMQIRADGASPPLVRSGLAH